MIFLSDPQLVPLFGIIFSFRGMNNIYMLHISVDRGRALVLADISCVSDSLSFKYENSIWNRIIFYPPVDGFSFIYFHSKQLLNSCALHHYFLQFFYLFVLCFITIYLFVIIEIHSIKGMTLNEKWIGKKGKIRLISILSAKKEELLSATITILSVDDSHHVSCIN